MNILKPFAGLTSRRSMLRGGLVGPGLMGAALLAGMPSTIRAGDLRDDNEATEGDVSILRFLAALEILEADLWEQYNELGGIRDSELTSGTGSKPYTDALNSIDGDMSQYIHDNTDDEFSHAAFLNAVLQSKNALQVSLEKFRNLDGSQATGSSRKKRLTNLMQLTVDTSWWTRYRSSTRNPDLGDVFPPAVPTLATGEHTAIPRNDADLNPPSRLQAIANTAAFHFGTIEQGGSSLYPSLAQRVSNVEVLRILLAIGPTETMHFQVWHDKAGNVTPLIDPVTGLVFPDLAGSKDENLQGNLIMPEPTIFSRKFPNTPVSIIRPTETKGAAKGAVDALTADGLFKGQSPAFFNFLNQLASEADEAQRDV
jgi:Ferritin-like domain